MRQALASVSVKAVSEKDRIIRMVASTESVDRQGDIVRQGGWSLEKYRKNPVILWGHDYNLPPVARAVKTEVEDGALVQDWHFPEEYGKANALSEIVFKGYSERVLNAASVGFMPLVITEVRSQEERSRLGLGPWGVIVEEAELWEVSAVNVPANADALRILSAKGINTEPLASLWSRGQVYEVKGYNPVPSKGDTLEDLSLSSEEDRPLIVALSLEPEPVDPHREVKAAVAEVGAAIPKTIGAAIDRIVKARVDFWRGKV